jgi:putative SOS response-associated peptidase YedK
VFVRPKKDSRQLEEVFGQWGLIGWFAKTPQPEKVKGRSKILTNNARFETIHKLATYNEPRARGQRCIIPAGWHVEPCWESGKNVWWQLRLAGPHAHGLAGIWNTWTDKASGEIWESYSMVTVNCDHHPLLNRMHRPDPMRPDTEQDKRAVVPLARDAIDAWLFGTVEEASAALVLPLEEQFEAAPEAQRLTGSLL